MKTNFYNIKPGQLFIMPSYLEDGQTYICLKLQDQKAVNLDTHRLVRFGFRDSFEVITKVLALTD